MAYQPKPLDNFPVELSADLKSLIEVLARNNHEVWAKRRMEEGWKWGPLKDETKKETPSMIPYEQLSESEKAYDRDNAIETLRTILALGYKIEPPTRRKGD